MDELRRHSEAIATACRKYGVRKLEVFGSFARGEARPDSDVDLLVDFSNFIPKGAADRYFGLLFDLENLLGRSVDLLTVGSLKNPYLIAQVNKERTVLYAAQPEQTPA